MQSYSLYNAEPSLGFQIRGVDRKKVGNLNKTKETKPMTTTALDVAP